MRHLLVLGGGTAGTMAVAKLRPRLPASEWRITVVDQDDEHHYQPAYLFIPFGDYRREDAVKRRSRFIPAGVDLVFGRIAAVDPERHTVTLEDGAELAYDQLIVATGTTPRPEETPGTLGPEWRRSVHEFYTLEGALTLAEAIEAFDGGRLVVHITEMPIKCPVAPLELLFLADAHFRERGMRDRVELVYVTPLDGAFTKPVAAARLGHLLEERGIAVETDFMVERIDGDAKALVSYDEREIAFDLLVTVPLNKGADFLAGSGLADHLNYVQVDKHTLQSRHHSDVFALGDAADLPTSKAGATAHYSIEVFTENFLQHARGRPMTHAYDGHANCFVETGHGKGLLLDFNYETQPLPGRYPLPGIGPFALLEETEMNHAGKLMFKWAYWHVLLRGRELPLPAEMSLAGKALGAAS
jgi:sulfide:quinone oxidoreductase